MAGSGDRLDMDALGREGYVVTELLDGGAVASLREAAEGLAGRLRAGFDSTLLSGDKGLRAEADHLVRSALVGPVAELLDGVRIAFCSFVAKSPDGGASEVPLHQDWSFVDEARYCSLGLWCPLVDVDAVNGCLQIVPGSHVGVHAPRAAFSPFRYAQIAEQLRGSYLFAVPMQAGQAMLFDNRLMHASPPNRSARLRVAATAVLVPSEAQLLYYHMADRRDPDRVEVFEVEDSFYLTNDLPQRPKERCSVPLGAPGP
jgi:ectoine hydroxylase-related dioxygenase (phytanoyl-CoA dioxygenase family)